MRPSLAHLPGFKYHKNIINYHKSVFPSNVRFNWFVSQNCGKYRRVREQPFALILMKLRFIQRKSQNFLICSKTW
jgi:hypothetical protein